MQGNSPSAKAIQQTYDHHGLFRCGARAGQFSFFLLPLMLSLSLDLHPVAGVGSTGSGSIYAMTKAAVEHLAKALSCELAKYKIRVNCVAPWVTATELFRNAIKNNPEQMDKVESFHLSTSFHIPSLPQINRPSLTQLPLAFLPPQIAQRTPLGRVAEPREIASCVVFFSLPAASYVTGQTLCADGGLGVNFYAGPCCE